MFKHFVGLALKGLIFHEANVRDNVHHDSSFHTLSAPEDYIKNICLNTAEPRVYLGIPFTRVTVNLN